MVSPKKGFGVVDRRSILRMAVGGAALGVTGTLAACSSSPSSSGTTGSSSKGKATLTVGITGGGVNDGLDAQVIPALPDQARAAALYEPLVFRDADFKLNYILAESITPSDDGTRWTVDLRDGVTFHDGRPLTAEDVLFSLQRIADPTLKTNGASGVKTIDFDRTKVVDKGSLVIQLHEPSAVFVDTIAQYYNNIVPSDYDPANPVGTGPFRFDTFEPGRQSSFVRYDKYWRTGLSTAGRLVIVDFPDESAKSNALFGGQVDAVDSLPASQISVLKGRSDLKLLTSETGSFSFFAMRTDTPPFDDPRVRQAFRLLVDRPQMVAQALSGEGRVANDLYSPFDAAFNDTLPQRKQDITRARALLAEAGHDGLSVELTTADVAAGVIQSAQVLVEQAKAAGVEIKLRKVSSDVLFGDNYLKWSFTQDYASNRSLIAEAQLISLPDSPYNVDHYSNPDFARLVTKASTTLDETKRTEMLHEAQRIMWEDGGLIIWGFNNQIGAHSAKVGGLRPNKTGIPLNGFNFAEMTKS